MGQRTIDVALAVLGSAVGFLLSIPFWRDNEYWAESPLMWNIYFIGGFALAVYVFYVYLGCLRTLFEHDALDHAVAKKEGGRE